MADFCRQCSIETFGQDFGDLAGLVMVPGSLALTICEGCGIVYVNHLGECADPKCKRHGAKEEEEAMFWFKHKRTGQVRAFATPEAADHLEWAPHISDEPTRDEPEPYKTRDVEDDDNTGLATTLAEEEATTPDPTPDAPGFEGGGGSGGGGGASSDW
jgi:hypothetical protein